MYIADSIIAFITNIMRGMEILLNNHNFYTLEYSVGNNKPMGIIVC